jgi:hypothetical protein
MHRAPGAPGLVLKVGQRPLRNRFPVSSRQRLRLCCTYALSVCLSVCFGILTQRCRADARMAGGLAAARRQAPPPIRPHHHQTTMRYRLWSGEGMLPPVRLQASAADLPLRPGGCLEAVFSEDQHCGRLASCSGGPRMWREVSQGTVGDHGLSRQQVARLTAFRRWLQPASPAGQEEEDEDTLPGTLFPHLTR